MQNSNSWRMELIRTATNRGRFYPAEAGEIRRMINRWNAILDGVEDYPVSAKPKAIVAPHAGYVYSGFTANAAHRLLGNTDAREILVVGPSHHVYFRGMSIGPFSGYETPFGFLAGSGELYDFLAGKFDFVFERRAHGVEHSTETQFPFIRYYNPDASIVELIYGDADYRSLVPVLESALRRPGTAVVISTDLSHYYDQHTANRLDAHCLEAVRHGDLQEMVHCEACGKIGLTAIIAAANALNLRPRLIDYRTSGDITGDYSAVVGYMSAIYSS